MRCPCESGLEYAECCQAYHARRSVASTAEALMRSHYAAYVLGELEYLLETTHPSARHANLKDAYQSTHDSIRWIDLRILATFQGGAHDKTGKVEFEGTFLQGGQRTVHHEKSRFKRRSGNWYYLDREITGKHPA